MRGRYNRLHLVGGGPDSKWSDAFQHCDAGVTVIFGCRHIEAAAAAAVAPATPTQLATVLVHPHKIRALLQEPETHESHDFGTVKHMSTHHVT